MRLAYFVDSMELGGSELNSIRTLEHLDRSRFDLTVFHMGHRGPLLARYADLGVPMVRVSLKSFKHPSAFVAGLQFVSELRRRRIHILHSHDIYSNIFAIPWARIARTPVVLASKRWHQAVPSRAHAIANRIVTRMASRVLANSTIVADSLVREDGVPRSRIMVVPNFVGVEAFEEYPAVRRAQTLAGFGIPPDALVVGVVARLSPVKNHAMLLRAAIPLCAAHPNLHVLLIGEGPTCAALEAQVLAGGLVDRVHFAGQLSNIPNPHGLLDISVLTSRSEGSPNSLVEAMAAGRPVVATAVGGVPELVVVNQTGLLVPSDDDSAMVEALQRMIDSPEVGLGFGRAGRERARTLFHVDAVLGRLSEWYGSLLSGD